MFTPWHIWIAFLLDLAFGSFKWIPRPSRAVLWAIHFIKRLLVENGVLKIGEKRAGVLLAFAVIVLTSGTGALLVLLGGYLHKKIALVVLLYLAYTTLTLRSFGDTAHEVFEWLQSKNLLSAQKALSLMVRRNTEGMLESEVVESTVLAIAGNITHGVVAPIFFLSLGGVPLALAYQAINTLYFALGEKDVLYQGWGFGSAWLYDLANAIPVRITALLMVIAAVFLFGTGTKTLMILFRNILKVNNPTTGISEFVTAGAIGMTLRNPSADVAVLPIFPLHEDEMDAAEVHHIMDAIKLMCAVACVMLILCMMMG